MADDSADRKLKLVRARLAMIQGQILAADEASLDEILLETKLETIIQLDKDHQDLVMELMENIEEEELHAALGQVAQFDRDYGDLNIQIRRKLKSLRPPPFIKNETPEPNRSDALPPIPLPTFSGEYGEFIVFCEQFEQRVVSKTDLADSAKLGYLRSALKGEAASIQSSTDSFQSLWAALKNRYQVKRLLSESHINQLFSIKRMAHETAAELQRVLDVVIKNLRVLNSLDLPLDCLSEQMVINIVISKLDEETQKAFQVTQKPNDLPTWAATLEFLQGRSHALGTLELSRPSTSKSNMNRSVSAEKGTHSRSHALHATTGDSLACPLCKGNHFLNQCRKFRDMTVGNRLETAVKFGICTNCLRASHPPKDCPGGSCRKCHERHNTFLHQDKSTTEKRPPAGTVAMHTSVSLSNCKKVMLSTVLLQILDLNGHPHVCRALLDSGSESNMMSARIANTLKLEKLPASATLIGVNDTQPIRHRVYATIRSMAAKYIETLEFIVKTIPTDYPSTLVDTVQWTVPTHVKLADPGFNQPGPIDLLLGAEVFFDLLTHEKLRLEGVLPPLQGTVFGWIVAGRLFHQRQANETKHFCGFVATTDENLHDLLKKFWELETTPSRAALTVEERQVDQHYINTHRRDASGRYVVSLPTKPTVTQLGDSEKMARRRFNYLEKRLLRQPELRVEYSKFMEEYLRLGHMVETAPETDRSQNTSPSYYLPHHAVLRPDSITTKLRVVFDASAKTSTGLSLNDTLSIGATIQQDLFDILLRFRKHKVAMSADISKMYRQILVDEADQPLQKILWRFDPREPIKVYQLKTVTYGTACAPFLATRSLVQLADDETSRFPEAAQVTKKDFYVDDLLTGCSSESEAKMLHKQLVSMLQRGGFELHKWCSNARDLFKSDENQPTVYLTHDQTVKTLGLVWMPASDLFRLTVGKMSSEARTVTKRTILSDSARLFDPLGISGPIVVVAKLMLQKLWQLQVQWDDPVPDILKEEWFQYRKELENLQMIEFPRRAIPFLATNSLQLVGFCDASLHAYGACVYLYSVGLDGQRKAELLCAKSRVAPLKTATIPRLELCGAVLLAQLVDKVVNAMEIQFDKVILWCDSTIVLSWLKSVSGRMKTFVSHRVAEIQNLTRISDWRHVPTDENPADLISRGIMPSKLPEADLWWHGPPFLQQDESTWPSQPKTLGDSELPEMKEVLVLHCQEDEPLPVFAKFSSFLKLRRVVAFALRFVANCRRSRERRVTDELTVDEMMSSLKCIVRASQQRDFSRELRSLKESKPISTRSSVYNLNIFLDSDGIIRVGGRLEHSQQPYDVKHPMLLPKNDHTTTILVRSLHYENGHAGAQALTAIVRQMFWPVGVKNLVKRITKDCLVCFRCRPKVSDQFMGDLPAVRVTAAHPFINTGVDYAGPLTLKLTQRTSTKAYMALFVCMATKAVHLELVSDLTTKAFLAALTRFISRRGHCSNIYSDNATNFVGARNEMDAVKKLLSSRPHQDDITRFCASKHITFKFIPPRAPHFGGLWEAGIKSAKYHMLRIIGPRKLYFEEMATILTKVEAILNSRPLIPGSDDTDDVAAITPGHFLIGRPLNALAEPNYADVQANHLNRWETIQQMSQHFWRKWSAEYLTTLQQRTKKAERAKIAVGELVLVKEENLPTLQWLLGRVTKVTTGKDGLVRVVTLRTKSGEIDRPVAKICVLPKPSEPRP